MKNLLKNLYKKKFRKKLFTPGPASLLEENILSIQPCFGRGDETYEKLENKVLNKIKKYLAILLLLVCKVQQVCIRGNDFKFYIWSDFNNKNWSLFR